MSCGVAGINLLDRIPNCWIGLIVSEEAGQGQSTRPGSIRYSAGGQNWRSGGLEETREEA